jgi:hypothetical protein
VGIPLDREGADDFQQKPEDRNFKEHGLGHKKKGGVRWKRP